MADLDLEALEELLKVCPNLPLEQSLKPILLYSKSKRLNRQLARMSLGKKTLIIWM